MDKGKEVRPPCLEQAAALGEIRRVLRPEGSAIMSIPNLAHLASRWRFFFKGKLARTARVSKHPGDRPVAEYLSMLRECGLSVQERVPIKLTLPSFAENALRSMMGAKRFETFIFSPKRAVDYCFVNVFVLKPR